MHPEVANFAVVASIIVLFVGALSTISIKLYRAVLREQRRDAMSAPPNDGRLELLQQSVDSIAVEVERIAEAQRFSAKLLAERANDPVLPR